jgi:hypothetical protein
LRGCALRAAHIAPAATAGKLPDTETFQSILVELAEMLAIPALVTTKMAPAEAPATRKEPQQITAADLLSQNPVSSQTASIKITVRGP